MRACTTLIEDPGDLIDFLPDRGGIAFLRGDEGMVAWGEVARFETDSLDAADIWWEEFIADVEHASDAWDTPAAGPVAFGSFAFDPDHSQQSSVLIVPEVIVGRRQGVCWVTRMGPACDEQKPLVRQPEPTPPGEIAFSDGAFGSLQWRKLVGDVVTRIEAGDVEKVVLARELVASTSDPIDPRWPLRWLSANYPKCWTYWVDDLLGSSPEMLVRRRDGLVASKVLAGTIRRSGGDDTGRLAMLLTQSGKDLAEHEFAVASVAGALQPYCGGLNVPEAPYVLQLPNVMHLATDITAAARPGATSLALAAALHPSAAVCGTPTHLARDIINESEQLDRGRYAGPVGWIDAEGDGEWAIALRCGRLDPDLHLMHLYAGCGIVAGSDPDEELIETVAKFVPMRDALGDSHT